MRDSEKEKHRHHRGEHCYATKAKDFSGAPHNDSCLIMLREYQTDAVYFVRIFVMQSVNSTGLSILSPAASKA